MAEDQETYIAVLKATYDYDPQPDAEDEIAVKEGQILLLVERVDDDWWRVKVKQEEDSLPGLVPAAYVEPYEHTSVVKAQYDYEAQAPGELSVKEDEMLFVFDKDDAWLLVHSQKPGGKVGFVPENYVEAAGNGAKATAPPAVSQIVIPDSPPRPSAPYVDPEALVASTANKAKADKIQTWSVSEIDKKGKKKKGTLGVGNGAVYFASESDKTPVQQWQTSFLQSAHVDKGKHVLIEVGGPSPLSLHFHAGSKDNAEAIIDKLKASKELSSSTEVDVPERPRSSAAKSVHFDADPDIIPPRDDSEDGEEVEELEEPEPVHEPEELDLADGDAAVVLYDFTADGEDELSVKEGESLIVLERDGDDWWRIRNSDGLEGVVPASYMELLNPAAASHRDNAAEEARKAAAAEEEATAARQAAEEADAAAKKEEIKKQAAAQRAKAAAVAAEADRKRREEERTLRDKEQKEQKERDRQRQLAAEAEAETKTEKPSSSGRNSSSAGRSSNGGSGSRRDSRGPPPDNTRVWHDRSGQFRVEAAFLGFANGKIRLHKSNGVVIEVPAEKMSPEDLRYVDKLTNAGKRKSESSPSKNRGNNSSDDESLASRRNSLRVSKPPKKSGPKMDWFEFFLNAGCDVDDCTRYTSSFERDKIDEAILPDITESTMRSLGLREGDIIRVKKLIDQRKPKGQSDQEKRDAELAKKLQDDESAGRASPSKFPPVAPAPNLFAGPNGALKQPRRGRPQPSKSLPPSSVDITAISAGSDQTPRTTSPSLLSPGTPPVQAPPRSSSVSLAPPSGFDDDAWTNRPSSTKPATPTPLVAPPASAPPSAVSAPLAQLAPTQSAPTPLQSQPTGGRSLAKTTEDDVFEQLARLSQLRVQSPAVSPPAPTPPMNSLSPVVSPPPRSFSSGMGMGSSPVPMSQVQTQPTGMPQQMQNGPRGPFAPVPSNQSLLHPLIPTTTGFNSFIPTRPGSSNISPFQPQQQNFLSSQPTGFPGVAMSNPTGFQSPFNNPPQQQSPFNNPPQQSPFQQNGLQQNGFQPSGFQPTGIQSQPTGFQPGMMSQPAGMQSANGFGMGTSAFQTNNYTANVQSNPTGFNPGLGQSQFANSMAPPVPPLPQHGSAQAHNPANVFAQMKAGTFANNQPQPANYDAFRANPMTAQPTGWNPGPGTYGAF